MAYNHEYPYTDPNRYNSDWILHKIKELMHEMDTFEALNKITNAGAWDITKQYQAWTVVSDNNIGYISLKPVPAGVAISNTEYWGVIADYNILITDLSNRISALEAADAVIDKRLDRLENRFFVFIGDSYSIGTSGGQSVTNFGWVDQVISYLNLQPGEYVRGTAAEIGNKPAFYPTTSDHRSWRDSIEIIYNRMTDEEISKVTDVVCCGGFNESFGWDIDQTRAGMVNYMAFVREKFPGATYWLGEIGMQTGMSSAVIAGRDFILDQVIPCYSQAAEYGFRVMAGTDRILWNNTQTTDGIHPTEAVYKLIGKAIANNLLGTAAQFKYAAETHDVQITPASSFTLAAGSGKFKTTRFEDGSRDIYYDGQILSYNYNTPQIIPSNYLFQLGTYDTTYMPGKGQTVMQVPMYFTLANNNMIIGTATLYFGSGIIMMSHNVHQNFFGGVNQTRINLGPFYASALYPALL